jgi:hypothetical protein
MKLLNHQTMKNNIAKLTLFSLVAAALVAAPAISRAEDSTNAPAAAAPAAKKKVTPFRGNVAAVDAAATTFTVGTLTIAVTSETKITKAGQPATFADITVGEAVGGAYKKDDTGKLNATTVKIGAKKKKAAAE